MQSMFWGCAQTTKAMIVSLGFKAGDYVMAFTATCNAQGIQLAVLVATL